MKSRFFLITFTFLSFSVSIFSQSSKGYDLVVALDGSGDFTSVQEAVNACRAFMPDEKTIFIKNGVYKEKVLIYSYLTNITLVGESADKTIITNSDHANMPGFGTFNSYTLKVLGEDIILKNLTIENAAGPVGQAVALHVEGDRITIVGCKLIGNQDTLYAAGNASRQFYSDCYIEGTTDFIFGSATAIFENCIIHSKRESYITAANTPKGRKYGFVFRNCKLTANEDILKVYLGRPWRDYAKVVFLNCEMGAHIRPEGWHNWKQPNREKTAFYAEYLSSGKGANVEGRVNWSHQLNDKEAKEYSNEKIFSFSDNWEF